MGLRPFFGTTTLSGSAQPVFGTALTAAVVPLPDQFSGKNDPASNQTQVSLTVTSTKGFIPGDRIQIGPTNSFNPGLATAAQMAKVDNATIKSITDATHMVVQGVQLSHAASGEWVVLNEDAGSVHIRPVVTTAAVYIGNASTVAAGDASVMDILPIVAAGAGPTYFFDATAMGLSQPYQTAQFWMNGTAADTVLARFSQI
jgi:hypothetical protein